MSERSGFTVDEILAGTRAARHVADFKQEARWALPEFGEIFLSVADALILLDGDQIHALRESGRLTFARDGSGRFGVLLELRELDES